MKPTKAQKEFLEEFKVFLAFKLKTSVPIREIKHIEEIQSFEKRILNSKTLQDLKNIYLSAYNFGITNILNLHVLFLFYHYLHDLKIKRFSFIQEAQVVSFLFGMAQTRKTSTVSKYTTCLRMFFDFLDKRRKFCFYFSLKRIAFIKENKKLPKHLEKTKLLNFIKTLLEYDPINHYEVRNKCILLIILLGGLRKSEALNLTMENIKKDGELYLIDVVGKGQIERKIYIPRHFLEKSLQQWTSNPTKIQFFSGKYLFKKDLKTPQKTCSITRLIKKIYRLAKIECEDYGYGLHVFRHSFATLIYSETQDLILTAKSLGHQNIESTKIYIHTDNEVAKTASVFKTLLL